jgi:hypothetical protein
VLVVTLSRAVEQVGRNAFNEMGLGWLSESITGRLAYSMVPSGRRTSGISIRHFP